MIKSSNHPWHCAVISKINVSSVLINAKFTKKRFYIIYITGWPVIHGCVFLIPWNKWLVQCTHESSVDFLQDTRTTRPCLSGRVVKNPVIWIITNISRDFGQRGTYVEAISGQPTNIFRDKHITKIAFFRDATVPNNESWIPGRRRGQGGGGQGGTVQPEWFFGCYFLLRGKQLLAI